MNEHEFERAFRAWSQAEAAEPASATLRVRVLDVPLTTRQGRGRWAWIEVGRFGSIISATKFVVAGAIVALFGGFLLAGLLAQPSDDMAPAAVTASPSPTTTEDLLSSMVTEEVEPGVYRVDTDGIRPLTRPLGIRPSWDIHRGMEGSIVAGLDGSVWWFDQDGLFRLGEPGVHAWPNDRDSTFWYREGRNPTLLTIDIEVGPDGTVWLARSAPDPVYKGEISSFDGESWTVRQEMSDEQGTLGVEVLEDGTIWAAWTDTVARLGDTGWEPIPLFPSGVDFDLSVTAASGGEVWLMPGRPRLLRRYDGTGWAEQTTPGTVGEVVRADVGPDGTLWVRLDPACGEDCRASRSDMLARFDGTEWETFDGSDGIPTIGEHQMLHPGFFEIAPDGSVWFDPTVPFDEEAVDTDCDGAANFDGETVTRYLRGMCIYAMDVAPDSAVWLQAGDPGDDDPTPIHTYVITPEAVTATE